VPPFLDAIVHVVVAVGFEHFSVNHDGHDDWMILKNLPLFVRKEKIQKKSEKKEINFITRVSKTKR
jgi:hypothetical protein